MTNAQAYRSARNAAEVTAFLIGRKTCTALFNAPEDSPSGGRMVRSPKITDGVVATSGTARWWAATAGNTLLIHAPLSGAFEQVSGNSFTLDPLTVRMPAS